MTFTQTLDYLYSQLPMYHRVGEIAFKKDLDNTIALCNHLGNPENKFKSIHVGGTNGKGSCSHILAATFQEAGFKVGLYTSPHYKDFRERIKINGNYISRKYICEFVENNRPVFEAIQPSFFEMTVALAFAYFADKKVDIAIIEVGLGGRLDSTNVIRPELSIITNISFDHMNMLGDTLPKIAFEKAGIIKQNTEVVVGEYHPESAPVFKEKAVQMNAQLSFADHEFQVEKNENENLFLQKNHRSYDKFFLDGGLGRAKYQEKNLITCVSAIEKMEDQGWKVNVDHLKTALLDLRSKVKFVGRWQQLGENPVIIADSCHNEAGVRMAIKQLKAYRYRQLHIVTGFVNDKDVHKVLSLYPEDACYYFAKANIPRGLDAKVLQQLAAKMKLKGKSYSSVKNAFRAAKKHALPEDMIIVLGSIFVVAEVL
ncbi:MAG: bifunctional folylpolyglutamate synthase/dihydrofolate synthase [Saprospiraceae bacterium]